MVHCQNKGKDFERFIANWLKSLGLKAKRAFQFRGASPDDPDVVCEDRPNWQIECKAVEGFTINDLYYGLLKTWHSGKGKIPLLFYKKNKKGVIVVLRLEDLPRLLCEERKQTCEIRLTSTLAPSPGGENLPNSGTDKGEDAD